MLRQQLLYSEGNVLSSFRWHYSNLKLLSDPSILASSERGGLIARSDMALHNQDWTENVIGKVSEWIDLDCTESNTR